MFTTSATVSDFQCIVGLPSAASMGLLCTPHCSKPQGERLGTEFQQVSGRGRERVRRSYQSRVTLDGQALISDIEKALVQSS